MIYLEDIHEGDTSVLGPIHVTREEALDFARKYDPQPFHLDDEAAAAHPFFKKLSISGWQTCAYAMRLMVDEMRERNIQSLGSPGIDNIRWLKPVYPGDDLTLHCETKEVRASRSRPGMGSARRSYALRNQNDEGVMTLAATRLFATRPA